MCLKCSTPFSRYIHINSAQNSGGSLRSNGVQFAISSAATATLLSISDKDRAGSAINQLTWAVGRRQPCSGRRRGSPPRSHGARCIGRDAARMADRRDIPHRIASVQADIPHRSGEALSTSMREVESEARVTSPNDQAVPQRAALPLKHFETKHKEHRAGHLPHVVIPRAARGAILAGRQFGPSGLPT